MNRGVMVVVSKNIAVDYCHLEVGLREVFLPASPAIIALSKVSAIACNIMMKKSYKTLSYYKEDDEDMVWPCLS